MASPGLRAHSRQWRPGCSDGSGQDRGRRALCFQSLLDVLKVKESCYIWRPMIQVGCKGEPSPQATSGRDAGEGTSGPLAPSRAFQACTSPCPGVPPSLVLADRLASGPLHLLPLGGPLQAAPFHASGPLLREILHHTYREKETGPYILRAPAHPASQISPEMVVMTAWFWSTSALGQGTAGTW